MDRAIGAWSVAARQVAARPQKVLALSWLPTGSHFYCRYRRYDCFVVILLDKMLGIVLLSFVQGLPLRQFRSLKTARRITASFLAVARSLTRASCKPGRLNLPSCEL